MLSKILDNTSRLEKRARSKVAQGRRINVLFLESSSNISKVSILKELSCDADFNVSVLSHDQSDISKALYQFAGVKHILGGTLEDIVAREDIDILFLDNPHYYLDTSHPTHDFYKRISSSIFEKALFCYIPYAYISVSNHEAYTDYFHKFSWKFFLESHFHLLESRKFTNNVDRLPNQIVTGHPYIDPYLTDKYDFDLTQAMHNTSKFRITWCPHHNPVFYGGVSITEQESALRSILESEQDVEIYFRPHPNLLASLKSEVHINSADYQTLLNKDLAKIFEEYWLKNDRVVFYDKGPVYQVFKNSDLIIHNCGGYQMEAIFSGSPIINLVNQGILNDHILQYKSYQSFCSEPTDFKRTVKQFTDAKRRKPYRITGQEDIPLAATLIKRHIMQCIF